jgi:Clathrin light chain
MSFLFSTCKRWTVGSNRLWRERQDEEIKTRNERSKTRRHAKSKAERAIDQFYEDYNVTSKCQIWVA